MSDFKYVTADKLRVGDSYVNSFGLCDIIDIADVRDGYVSFLVVDEEGKFREDETWITGEPRYWRLKRNL